MNPTSAKLAELWAPRLGQELECTDEERPLTPAAVRQAPARATEYGFDRKVRMVGFCGAG